NPQTGKLFVFAPVSKDPTTGQPLVMIPTSLFEMQEVWDSLPDEQKAKAEKAYAEMQSNNMLMNLLSLIGELDKFAFEVVTMHFFPASVFYFAGIALDDSLKKRNYVGAAMAAGMIIIPLGDLGDLTSLTITLDEAQLATLASTEDEATL